MQIKNTRLNPSHSDRSIPATKAIEGKNGFLFLQNDTNNVYRTITGEKKLSSTMLKKWINIIDDRTNFCKKNGCEYFIFIAPNKHCVYSDYLSDNLVISEERIARQLERLSPRVFYPFNILKNYSSCLTYDKLDTHWNEVGCCVAWNNFLQSKLENNGLDISKIESFRSGPGDLGSKINPTMSDSSFRVLLKNTSQEIWDNFLLNRGRIRFFKNTKSNSSLKRVVIFGDSFSNRFINRIADYFYETYFFHTPFFYEDVIHKLAPDVVINENIERFFYTPLSSRKNIEKDFLQFFLDFKYSTFGVYFAFKIRTNILK